MVKGETLIRIGYCEVCQKKVKLTKLHSERSPHFRYYCLKCYPHLT